MVRIIRALARPLLGIASVIAIAAPAHAQFPDQPKKPTAITVYWCGPGKTDCEITCTIGNTVRKFSNLNAARVQTYPGSDKLWLETSKGPNEIYLLGDALCDFSKIPISRPLN